MTLRVVRACLALLACSVADSQPAGPAPSFEVASIKPSAPRDPNVGVRVGCSGGPGSRDPGRWTCQNMSVANLVSMAYDLRRYQMPEIGDFSDRFDIAVNVPEGTTREQFRQMQQNLLEERFKLALHFEAERNAGL